MPKPRKADKPAGTYRAAKPPSPKAPAPSTAHAARYARTEDVQKVADKIFAERKELFRKLAQ